MGAPFLYVRAEMAVCGVRCFACVCGRVVGAERGAARGAGAGACGNA